MDLLKSPLFIKNLEKMYRLQFFQKLTYSDFISNIFCGLIFTKLKRKVIKRLGGYDYQKSKFSKTKLVLPPVQAFIFKNSVKNNRNSFVNSKKVYTLCDFFVIVSFVWLFWQFVFVPFFCKKFFEKTLCAVSLV